MIEEILIIFVIVSWVLIPIFLIATHLIERE
jgi:hypothetical protein